MDGGQGTKYLGPLATCNDMMNFMTTLAPHISIASHHTAWQGIAGHGMAWQAGILFCLLAVSSLSQDLEFATISQKRDTIARRFIAEISINVLLSFLQVLLWGFPDLTTFAGVHTLSWSFSITALGRPNSNATFLEKREKTPSRSQSTNLSRNRRWFFQLGQFPGFTRRLSAAETKSLDNPRFEIDWVDLLGYLFCVRMH